MKKIFIVFRRICHLQFIIIILKLHLCTAYFCYNTCVIISFYIVPYQVCVCVCVCACVREYIFTIILEVNIQTEITIRSHSLLLKKGFFNLAVNMIESWFNFGYLMLTSYRSIFISILFIMPKDVYRELI